MKAASFCCLLVSGAMQVLSQQSNLPAPIGTFLGQKPPGAKPLRFAQNTIAFDFALGLSRGLP